MDPDTAAPRDFTEREANDWYERRDLGDLGAVGPEAEPSHLTSRCLD